MKEIHRLKTNSNNERSVREFRKGYLINHCRSYKVLRKTVAELAYYNPSLRLYFRGQESDSRNDRGWMSLLPSIYRAQQSEGNLGNAVIQKLTPSILENRFYELGLAEAQLLGHLRYKSGSYGYQRICNHTELVWAILQHYGITKTPLLDVTPSLDVALSFAFGAENKEGVLYVIGVPAYSTPMQFDYLNDLVHLELASLMPPKALRPHFQSASLIGPWPLMNNKMSAKYDVARRIVSAFRLDRKNMERTGYKSIAPEILTPSGDDYERLCKKVRTDLKNISEDPELTYHSGLFRLFTQINSPRPEGERFVLLVVVGASREEAYKCAIKYMKFHGLISLSAIRKVNILNRSSQWHLGREFPGLISAARKTGIEGIIYSYHPNTGNKTERIK